MTNLAYLGGALVVCLLGWFALWLRHRRPRGMDAHMREFSRQLESLAPDPHVRPPARRTRTTRPSGDAEPRGRRPA